jgi:hypothetical protein
VHHGGDTGFEVLGLKFRCVTDQQETFHRNHPMHVGMGRTLASLLSLLLIQVSARMAGRVPVARDGDG